MMAAGLGFKTFTTGEVLTAGDVNGYLMQGINVFTNATARDAAITAPAEGQFAFTKDNNSLWYYDGAAWVASGATGDIEGVTAGVGISGGGTSGTVTITNSMATEITASGDIIVGTGSGTFDNLPIGTTGQLLTADTSVSPYKIKWATPAASASGLTLITRQSFSGVADTSTTFDGCFSTTYKNYQIVIENIESSTNNAMLYLQWRYAGPTTQASAYYGSVTNFDHNGATTNTTIAGAAQISVCKIGNSGSGTNGNVGNYYVSRVGDSGKPAITGQGAGNATTGAFNLGCTQDTQRTYTGFILSAAAGNITGTVAVYGLATA
jgi:hypothetical protein